MGTPHKYAEVIKAWADGALVEYRSSSGSPWIELFAMPGWWPGCEYRVKPVKKSPGLVYLANTYPAHPDQPWIESDVSSKTQAGAWAVIEAYKRGEIDEG